MSAPDRRTTTRHPRVRLEALGFTHPADHEDPEVGPVWEWRLDR